MRKPTVFVHRNLGVFNLVMPALMTAGMLLKIVWVTMKAGYQLLLATVQASMKVASTIREVRELHRVKEAVESARKSVPTAPDLEPAPKAQGSETTQAVSDEPPARVVRRAPVADAAIAAGPAQSSGISGADVKIADRHHTQKIGTATYLFSMYQSEGKVARFVRKGRDKIELTPFLRSTAASQRTAFSMEAAVDYTVQEVKRKRTASVKSRSTSGERSSPELQSMELPPASAYDSDYMDGPPPWLDTPPFGELDQPPGVASTGGAPPTAPAQEDGTGAEALIDRTVKSVRTEHEVDWRGSKRVEGSVVASGMTQVKRGKQQPYTIFALTLELSDGERKEFRGIELESLVAKQGVQVGDVVSLKQGRQEFDVTEGGRTAKRSRNVYDFKVIQRGGARSQRWK